MPRNLKGKCKQCRREGMKLFLKADRCNSPKCAMVKRNFPPGVHGVKGYTRLTGYGQQLREKQKVKKIYGILEKQMRNYFIKASKTRGNTEEALLQLLEMRFDNIIYRLGLAKSRDLARQLITHNHFEINGKKVNIPSYQLKVGDKITIQEKSRKIKPFANLADRLKGKEMVSWLFSDLNKMEFKITGRPSLAENRGEFDLKLIIEFYSK